jgi:hypothetical protein
MTAVELISLIASLASLILAIIAIWLSFKFFEKSNEASDKTIEASKGIGASVERLEKLFDKLYSDTFTMMKDTVSDMRKHIWNKEDTGESKSTELEEELEKKAQEKVDALKKELSNDLSQMFARQHITDKKITNLKEELSTLIEKAVSQTRTLESEAREETIREYILRRIRIIRKRKRRVVADDIVTQAGNDGLNIRRLFDEFIKMKEDGLIDFDGKEITGPDDEIRLL